MKLLLKVAKTSPKTGATLKHLLEELGHSVNIPDEKPEAVVCFGVGYQGELPSVNKNYSKIETKLDELGLLFDAGMRVPSYWVTAQEAVLPCLGRELRHSKGLDILVYRTRAAVLKKPSLYYTEIVPSETEFRTWVFRDHHLGTYEKVKVREPERKYRHKFGRSHRLGYAFQLVKQVSLKPEVVEIAKRAVKALELDFGAVDILWHPEGYPVVLEVNTAPGVEGEDRQAIRKLAENISRWLGRRRRARE